MKRVIDAHNEGNQSISASVHYAPGSSNLACGHFNPSLLTKTLQSRSYLEDPLLLQGAAPWAILRLAEP